LDFNNHSVLVGECIGSRSASVTKVADALPSKGLDNRSFVQVVNSSKALHVSSLPEAPLVRWKASCTTIQDGSRSFQAFLILRPQARRLVLLDM
jgi:hypothetical protein